MKMYNRAFSVQLNSVWKSLVTADVRKIRSICAVIAVAVAAVAFVVFITVYDEEFVAGFLTGAEPVMSVGVPAVVATAAVILPGLVQVMQRGRTFPPTGF